jgi:uncharacterized protein (TIGR03118 family)
VTVDRSAAAVYKGLALGHNRRGDFIFAANFHDARIDVFDSSFQPATLPGSFTDWHIPAGYAPFNVRNIGGRLFVTYAKQNDAKHDDVAGPGHGFVDVFDTEAASWTGSLREARSTRPGAWRWLAGSSVSSAEHQLATSAEEDACSFPAGGLLGCRSPASRPQE